MSRLTVIDAGEPARGVGERPAELRRLDPETASEALIENPRYQVFELHSAVLPDDRQVIVYVPPGYFEQTGRRYPVFYLHDGQNLFDGRTSYVAGCTWKAHTTADALTAAGEITPVILVGVANTGLRRMAEYTPTRDFRMGGGEGRRYGQLLIDELMPMLAGQFRVAEGAANTALGGSSLGGLISLSLGFEHPETFGRLAVMSPSLWWDHRSILNRINRARPRPELRIWLDMGTAEGAHHLRDTDQLFRLLLSLGWREGVDLHYSRVEGAVHDESAWAARFGEVLRFLFPA